jgi:hypothetical protein
MRVGKNQTTNPFTAEQFVLLEHMVADGKSWTEIGAACGHSPNSCSTTYSVRRKAAEARKLQDAPPGKDGRKSWLIEDVARLVHMRDVLHMSFQDIGRALGRTTASCHAKYNMRQQEPSPVHGQPEAGMRVTVSAAAIADRDARYQAWLRQSPAAALLGDPLPGRSALDQRGQRHD